MVSIKNKLLEYCAASPLVFFLVDIGAFLDIVTRGLDHIKATLVPENGIECTTKPQSYSFNNHWERAWSALIHRYTSKDFSAVAIFLACGITHNKTFFSSSLGANGNWLTWILGFPQIFSPILVSYTYIYKLRRQSHSMQFLWYLHVRMKLSFAFFLFSFSLPSLFSLFCLSLLSLSLTHSQKIDFMPFWLNVG